MMDGVIDAGLIESVKRKLAITWDNPETNSLLEKDIIPNSMVTLRERLGLAKDYPFVECGREKELLLALCFYTYNNAEDEFWVNYQKELMAVREKWRALEYVEKQEAPTGIS